MSDHRTTVGGPDQADEHEADEHEAGDLQAGDPGAGDHEAPPSGLPVDPHSPLPLHPLVYLADGDEVTVGRPDTDSYAILPPDGAELVRWLAAGQPPAEAADRYHRTYGEHVDMADMIGALHELGFVRQAGEDPGPPPPLRWQRLGRALFSVPAWLCYAALVTWAVVVMADAPSRVPEAGDLIFSDYYSVVNLTLLAVVAPLIALHESFHALAGRRIGIRSRVSLSHRFYFLVVETALDGLVTVPRRQRYLPILAGMLADVLALAALVVIADACWGGGAGPSFASQLCLAIAFATFTRLLWQFFFYIRTDIYVLITTVIGCVDLHSAALRVLRNRLWRLLRRPHRRTDETTLHPTDRRVARWYSWLIVVGYALSIATTVLALAPVFLEMFVGAVERFAGAGEADPLRLLDSVVFLALTVVQFALPARIALRDRARRAQHTHVIS
ncbi:hypothetical protein RM844_20525 [Streptomyces sp. DSM 44915]|uniref:Uncharacterized protein n=1 Tax=Streptomyces chisholmiae TaxID=3075540 RepID=A0ABU2JUL4_9ACTN|nr:hypothetical protein [Streptomyces sp. DSM 44915]MDT0268675.1 hypothetical protein [Streptomyces sp. DSM 44915]